MTVTITNVPERTYTGAGTSSPPVALAAGVWKEIDAFITLSASAKALWVPKNPNVVGEIIIEQDIGSGFQHWASAMFNIGDGDPNLLNASGNQIGLPAIYVPSDGYSRNVRVTVNVYTASPTGTLRLLNGTYNVGGSFTAGVRIEVVS